MPKLNNPSEIAREALKQLATRRLLPTPDNYRTLYLQISGTTENASDPFPENQFQSLSAKLVRETPEQLRCAQEFDQAVAAKHWGKTILALSRLQNGQQTAKPESEDHDWKALISELIRAWEGRQAGLTAARKRETLERLLNGNLKSEALYLRLAQLIAEWSQKPAVARNVDEPVSPENGGDAERGGNESTDQGDLKTLDALRDLFAYTLDDGIGGLLHDTPELRHAAAEIAHKIRQAKSATAIGKLLPDIKRLAFRFELAAEDQIELRSGLIHLLQLLIDNIAYLAEDDRWLHGQIHLVQNIVAGPLNLRNIDDAERRMKDVIFKQTQLKTSLKEAREAMKAMLAGFVDHLAAFSETTSDYHDKIEACAKKISAADNIADLESVIAEVVEETRVIRLNAQRSRDELHAMRSRVREAEAQVDKLQKELERTSALVRQDQLTGALNRRGLEDVFEKEIARSRRHGSALSIGVLDIDNFKKLNDSLGHDAGDAALIHLTTVIRDALRPQDTLARYGGEEFVILFPDTPLEEGRKALVRLQRELTKKFFLHNNQKLLITFSAGVTEIPAAEGREAAIKRADELMYQAKTTGKNKVVSG